jgi:hypothetical protein
VYELHVKLAGNFNVYDIIHVYNITITMVFIIVIVIVKHRQHHHSPRQLCSIIVQKTTVLLLAQTQKQLRQSVARLLHSQVCLRAAHVSLHPSCAATSERSGERVAGRWQARERGEGEMRFERGQMTWGGGMKWRFAPG